MDGQKRCRSNSVEFRNLEKKLFSEIKCVNDFFDHVDLFISWIFDIQKIPFSMIMMVKQTIDHFELMFQIIQTMQQQNNSPIKYEMTAGFFMYLSGFI